MKRRLALLVILVALCFPAVLVVVAYQRVTDLGPVYTVAQVQAGLVHNARAWVGRTIRVRGIAVGISQFCLPDCSPGLSAGDARRSGGNWALALEPGAADTVPALLRRFALLLPPLPGPQHLHPGWGTYRVRLQPRPCDYGYPACYDAVLLNAAPLQLLPTGL